MRSFLALVHNETLKLLRRRRPHLVLAVLVAFLIAGAWAQDRALEATRAESGGRDWRAQATARLDTLERAGQRRRVFASFARFQRFEAVRLRYYLDRDIDPARQTGPLFARGFAMLASALLLPLLVTVLAADTVTAERSAGTIKMLLTRPVARWKVLASKVAVMVLFASLLVAAGALLSWAIGGAVFGWRGWGAPVFTGFHFTADGVDTSGVRVAPLWLDTLACYGLAWLGTLAVGSMAIAFSVLFRSSVGAMGTLLAILIAGSLLGTLTSDWTPAKWLLPTNLSLPSLYSGLPPPVQGMTVAHAASVLAAWTVVALAVAFAVFTRRDVTG